MNLTKKIVAGLCSAAILANAGATLASADAINDPNTTFDANNVVVSFGAMSDVHINSTPNDHYTKFASALQKLKDLAGGSDKLKTVMIAGDLFDASPDKEAPIFKGLLDANLNSNDTEIIPAVGNHDYYFDKAFYKKNKFRDAFGAFVYKNPVSSVCTTDDITGGNYHTVINGIHFISVFGFDGNHSQGDLNWLDKNLAEATKDNPDMPIFIDTHVIPANTCFGSDDDSDNDRWHSFTIGPILEKYPRAVIFAGHTHASVFEDNDVWQGKYTAINTGCIEDDTLFVQVDKAGVVKVSAYKTANTAAEMKDADKTWVFKTMAPLPVSSSTPSSSSASASSSQSSTSSDQSQDSSSATSTATSSQQPNPTTGSGNISVAIGLAVAAVAAGTVVLTSKKNH